MRVDHGKASFCCKVRIEFFMAEAYQLLLCFHPQGECCGKKWAGNVIEGVGVEG